MSAKEKVQQGLDARKDVKAAEAETEKVRKELEEAGHELVSMRINHELEQVQWKKEKHKLQDLLAHECEKNHILTDELAKAKLRIQENNHHVALVGAAQTIVMLAVLAVCRELGLMNYWLANGLLIGILVHLFYTVFVLLRKHK